MPNTQRRPVTLPDNVWELFEEIGDGDYHAGLMSFIESRKAVNREYEREGGQTMSIDWSKAPEWNGEGLPPVGCECEILGTAGGSWGAGVVDYIDRKHCVFHWSLNPSETLHNRVSSMSFRPIRTKEQRQKDGLFQTVENALLGTDLRREAVYVITNAILAKYELKEREE